MRGLPYHEDDASENLFTNEFANFETLSRLFGFTQFVKSSWIFSELTDSLPWTLLKFKMEEENSSSCVHVLRHKASH